MTNTSDATPAYRGYRRQALYILSQILTIDENKNLVFQPEGEEDLSITDTNEQLLEVMQVKSYQNNLVLSNFKPHKKDSFFYRVDKLLQTLPNIHIRIVSYGEIGPELREAIGSDERKRQAVARKLSGYNFISEVNAKNLLKRIQIDIVDENTLKQSIYQVLSISLAGIDPDAAFELLLYWIYICSEQKNKITRRDVIDRINKVGKFLSERAAYIKEWGTAIVPIEDYQIDDLHRQELTDEFYQGIAARYEHILANLDIVRHEQLHTIAQKFEENRIVIVHGVSGQGKSTLAYRYLHEFFPTYWRFKVQLIESRQHALSIATALAGHADAIGIPIVVYVDITASDRDWPDLVQQLAVHRNIRVLVTIREEDFQRTTITGTTIPAQVNLLFEEAEARQLYQSLIQRQASDRFLSFDEAWRKFGGSGPLMEFVYLITQGTSLFERLSQQVVRLEEDVAAGKLSIGELDLLRLVSVASAYDARLQVKPLVKNLELTVPKRTFKYFEKEYLVRLSDDGSLVYGIHPIRSAMLCKLLTDPTFTPWIESACTCLSMICKSDIEIFLLHTFSQHRVDTPTILQTLTTSQNNQWESLAGIMRALTWLGVREYVDANHELIRESFVESGKGWSVFLDYDVADAMSGVAEENWQTLSQMVSDERRRKIELMQARQTDKQQIFAHTQAWLTSRTEKPASPISDADWLAMAETLFWIGRLGIVWPISEWLSDVPFDTVVDKIPIEMLSYVVLGLSEGYPHFFNSWIMQHRSHIATRFRQTTQTLMLEDDGTKVTAHFIVEIESKYSSKSIGDIRIQAAQDRFHEEALIRIEMLRRLFPDREVYACQGYGHNVLLADSSHDSTKKTGIAHGKLPLLWLTSINSTFRILAEREFRPSTWREYAEIIINLRQHVIVALRQLMNALEQYFRSQQLVKLIGSAVNIDDWTSCTQRLNHPILFPSCALDEWGLTDEFSNQSIALEMQERIPLVGQSEPAFQGYREYHNAFRSYSTHLSNFFEQSVHAMALNVALGRNAKDKSSREGVLAQAERLGIKAEASRLSTLNFAETVKALPAIQREFRNLLGQLVDDVKLAQVEHQEQNLFEQVWNLWYFFDTQPQRVVSHPHKLGEQTANILIQIRQALRREFRKCAKAEVKIDIASEKALWNFEPALWVTIDSEDALAPYEAFEETILAIRRAINKVPETELRRYILDFHWPYVVIIPLLRGKLLNQSVWRIHLLALLQEGELKWWNYFQSQLPSGATIDLNIDQWKSERLDPALKFLAHSTEVSLYAAHIKDFLRLPELDDEGTAQAQVYLDRVTKQFEAELQKSVDAGVIIVTTFNQLSSEEQLQHPNLSAAIRAFLEMQSYLMPASDFDSHSMTMTVTAIGEWAERLKKAREYAGLIYLSWATDVLNTSKV